MLYVFGLRPGAEAEYDRRHRHLSPDLLAEIRAAGILRNDVARHGRTVVVTVEHATDADEAIARVASSAAGAAWNRRFDDLLASQPSPMTLVWSLDDESDGATELHLAAGS